MSKQKVRESIECLCKVFCNNGTSVIVAETIRKAKFNKEEAVKPLWILLHEMCMLVCCGSLPVKHVDMDELVATVKQTMKALGYKHQDFTSSDVNTGSRDLLLALGWLLAKERVVDRFVLDGLKRLPVDTEHIHALDVEPKETPRLIVSAQLDLSDSLRNVVWLLGKCRMTLRSLTLLFQEKTQLIHKVHLYTNGATLSSSVEHLSMFETSLLRHPKRLLEMQKILEVTNAKLESYLQWKENKSIFWNWMESILDARLQEPKCARAGDHIPCPPDAAGICHPCPGVSYSRISHLQKLSSQLQASLEQWRLCASDVDDHISDMICREKHSKDPLKLMNTIKECAEQENIGCFQSRKVIPVSTHVQRFLCIRSETAAVIKTPQTTVSPGPSECLDVKLGIKDEISRLERRVEESKKHLQELREIHQEKLRNIFEGTEGMICMPPLAQKVVPKKLPNS